MMPIATMDILHIATALTTTPELQTAFNFEAIVKYIELIILLKPLLKSFQASHQTAPLETLPVNVHDFLKVSLDIPDDIAKLAWAPFRELAWSLNPTEEQELASRIKHLKLFLMHGIQRKIGNYHYYSGYYMI